MTLARSPGARLFAIDPFRADVLLAAVFVVLGAVEILLTDPNGANRPVTLVAVVIALSALSLRRRDPLVAAIWFTVPAVVQAPLDGFMAASTNVPFIAAILLLYSSARYATGWRAWAALLTITVGVVVALSFEDGWDGADEVIWVSLLFGLPALVGRALRARALLQAELREKAERAESDRAARARSAVEHERARIASELQALVANGVSAMVVQAEAVPRALAAGETARATEALSAVEETGRDALSEMRRLLGVLRREGDSAQLAPQPGLGRLGALLERIRARGIEVALTEEGTGRPLTPGIDLTAFRIVQDALETAVEGGATRAEVLVRRGDGELELRVRDDRHGERSERLAALRERAGLYDGFVSASRRDDGMFSVVAQLPLGSGSGVGART